MSDFTLSHYAKTLDTFLNEGYQFTDMRTHLGPHDKQIVLSHDIDMDASLVEKMASVEADIGISSTFFFRIRAKNYNLLSYESIQILAKLKSSGHDVGLHYEPPPVKDYNAEEDIKSLMNILGCSTGIDFSLFNIHEPTRTGIDISKVMPSMNRCHNSLWFNNFKYLSDSSARWREGCFSEHVGRWDKLLVLTHPFWWYSSSPSENY